VLCQAEVKPEGFDELCDVVGARKDLSGMKVLGIPVGSPAFIRQCMRERASEYTTELKALTPLATSHPKHAFAIWQQCSMATFNFLMRAVSPSIVEEVQDDVRQGERELLLHIMGHPCLDEDDEQDRLRWALASLPTSQGGLGVRDICEVASAAHLALWIDCLRSLRTLNETWADLLVSTWRDSNRKSSEEYRGITAAHSRLGKRLASVEGVDLFNAGNTIEAIAGYSHSSDVKAVGEEEMKEGGRVDKRRLQKEFTRSIYTETRWDLLSPVTQERRDLQIAMRAKGDGSNTWLTSFGQVSYLAFARGRRGSLSAFAPDEYRASLQISLHLSDPIVNAACKRYSKVMCVCGRKIDPKGWIHFLSCKWGGFSERHDEIVKILVEAAREAGLLVRGDKQSAPIGEKCKQSDLEIVVSGATKAFDVRVICAHSAMYEAPQTTPAISHLVR
jgi:hypothetical protein